MLRRVAPGVAAVTLLAAAGTVMAALGAGLGSDEDGGAETDDPDAVAELLIAYERSRTATFALEQVFTRTAPDGRELSYPRRLVQRPPDDRFVVGGGAAEGRLDGRVLLCSTSPTGGSRCDEGAVARPYEEEVEAAVDALRSAVDGANPAYRVRAGEPGCWSLHLRLAIPAPPYGELAGFCFDAETGAPLRDEIRRAEATDVVETVEIRTEVTAADLRPGDLGELPE